MTNTKTITLADLGAALKTAVAVRVIATLQPAGGKGSKVYPSTYGPSLDGKDKEKFGETKYAVEKRHIDGRTVECALLDSVASQANRMEQALRDGWDRQALEFPVVRIDFSQADLPEKITDVSTLDAPHRIYDAILRDSVDATGVLFRHTEAGKQVTAASPRDATALYKYCPTALVFGAWDSTGPKGGLGSKFPRAIASEIVAINIELGTRVASRIDPLQIAKVMDVVYKNDGDPEWATTGKKGKSVAPSEINHGNVTPSRDQTNGGITFDHARQTTVLSLPALRRLKFPVDTNGKTHTDRGAAEHAAHTALAALAIAAIIHSNAQGHDLRSGTLLINDGAGLFEIVGADGSATSFKIDVESANQLLKDAAAAAAKIGMGWTREPITGLKPAPKLVELLQRSQAQLASKSAGDS